MIVVREVLSLKFGKAKEAKALMLESKKFMSDDMLKRSRVLVDLVGHAYTMVFETSYNNLSEFEKETPAIFGKPEWQQWYQKMIPLVDKSYREIFTIVE
jgi:hypothetical protein